MPSACVVHESPRSRLTARPSAHAAKTPPRTAHTRCTSASMSPLGSHEDRPELGALGCQGIHLPPWVMNATEVALGRELQDAVVGPNQDPLHGACSHSRLSSLTQSAAHELPESGQDKRPRHIPL